MSLNNCPYIIWDVKDVSKAEEYVATAHDCFGSIDIFVNNAGIVTDAQWSGESFPNVSISTWDDTMDVNLRGIYFLCQAEAKYMIKNAITTMASPRGIRAMPREIANAIYVLATDDNMIGTILQTDGGRSLY